MENSRHIRYPSDDRNISFDDLPFSSDAFLSAMFVTWKKDGDLRGCIGTFAQDTDLHTGLRDYAWRR